MAIICCFTLLTGVGGLSVRALRKPGSQGILTARNISPYHIDEVDTHPNVRGATEKHIKYRHIWGSKYTPSQHTLRAFEKAKEFVVDRCPSDFDQGAGRPVIIDSGCGTGRSSEILAAMFPEIPVIGLDKSIARISRSRHWWASNLERTEDDSVGASSEEDFIQPNLLLLRCNVVDFWFLASTFLTSGPEPSWDVKLHSVLYPNPYPKPKHYQRRWHGHPVFPFLLQLGADELMLRASWKTYLNEFAQATVVASETLIGDMAEQQDKEGYSSLLLTCDRYLPLAEKGPIQLSSPGLRAETETEYLTNFEAKYFQCRQPVYELRLGHMNSL